MVRRLHASRYVLRLNISAPDYTILRYPSQPVRRQTHMVLQGNWHTQGRVLYCWLTLAERMAQYVREGGRQPMRRAPAVKAPRASYISFTLQYHHRRARDESPPSR